MCAHHGSNDRMLCMPFSMHIGFNREHNSKYRKISCDFFNRTFHLALASFNFFFFCFFICSLNGEFSFAWNRIGTKINIFINAISTSDSVNHSFGNKFTEYKLWSERLIYLHRCDWSVWSNRAKEKETDECFFFFLIFVSLAKVNQNVSNTFILLSLIPLEMRNAKCSWRFVWNII